MSTPPRAASSPFLFSAAPAVSSDDQKQARALMVSVFGEWRGAAHESPGWTPRPLPRGEAAEGPGGQRRYLWTDAFGLLNLVSQAVRLREAGKAVYVELCLSFVHRRLCGKTTMTT